MSGRGHPIRGLIGGFFLGLFLSIDFVLSGTVRLDSAAVTILPIVGLVVGLALGIWAPIGRGEKLPPPPSETSPAFEPAAWTAPAETPADPIPSPPPAPPAEGGTPPV